MRLDVGTTKNREGRLLAVLAELRERSRQAPAEALQTRREEAGHYPVGLPSRNGRTIQFFRRSGRRLRTRGLPGAHPA